MEYFLGIFLILHALVHLLYAGQSARLFELKPGMAWPEGAWAISRFLGDRIVRLLASVLLIVTAIALVVNGTGYIADQTWSRSLAIIAVIFSSTVFILLWNGKLENLDGQGMVGVFLNLFFLVVVNLL